MSSANDHSEGPISMGSTDHLEPNSLQDDYQTCQAPIMAICTDSSRCGSAIYADSSVHLVADRKDLGDPYKGLDIIIQRIDPQVVIVSSVQKKLITFLEKNFRFKVLDISRRQTKTKSSSACISTLSQDSYNQSDPLALSLRDIPSNQGIASEQLQPDHSEFQGVSEISEYSFTLAIVPNVWFSMSSGMQKLLDSELVKSRGLDDPEERSLFITSRVEKSADVCAIRAISALDNYILHTFTCEPNIDPTTDSNQSNVVQHVRNLQSQSQRTQASCISRPSCDLMPILEVKYVDPGPVLSIDKFSLEALGIFHHCARRLPDDNGFENPIDSDRKSIPSLFEVLNLCQSTLGRKRLRTLMMWPMQNLEELKHRHDVLDHFIKPENELLRDQISLQLKNLVPLSGLLTKLNHSVGSYRELSTIYKSLWAFFAIIDLIKANIVNNLEIFKRLIVLDCPRLRAVVDSFINVVDFEASRKEKRVQVCLGVDENVDEKRELIKNLKQFCDEIAVQETAKYKDLLGKPCSIIYLPRIGFLCSVNYSSTSELMQIKTNREFDVLLHTEQSVYFKTARMEELDNNAGDIACDLIDVQENVVINLQSDLLKHTETILNLMDILGELDCLIAFAKVSFQRGYTRPEFVSSTEEIDIVQAYHPLHCIKYNVVPNDIRFYNHTSERQVKVMVLTGPNSCGKTTYMKATCLVIYMAHIGCFVPASHARIPMVDAILTRMHSANSISTGLSSFATDLHQVNYALSRATENSLIAIDEFGKGTQTRDGFALLKALVTYFVIRMNKSPHVMIATHYNRLINHMQNYSEYIIYKTFKVTKDLSKDNIVYEFRLIDGVGEISLADQVALRAGVPQRIIERAAQVREYITGSMPLKPRPPLGA